MASKGMTEFRANGTDYTVNDPNIADEFDEDESYSKGEHVYHNGKLYRLTSDHAAETDWGNTGKEAAKVGASLKTLDEKIDTGDALEASTRANSIAEAVGHVLAATNANTCIIADASDIASGSAGYYINGSGEASNSSSSQYDRYTNFIPVTAGKYYLYCGRIGSNVRKIAFYSTNSVSGFISTVAAESNSLIYTLCFRAPENAAYMRATYNVEEQETHPLVIALLGDKSIPELTGDISDLLSAVAIEDAAINPVVLGTPNFTENCYIDKTGTLVQDPLWCVSEKITCVASVEYAYYYGVDVSGKTRICFFDASDNLLSSAGGNGGTFRLVTSPSSAAYCRMSFYKGYTGHLNRGATVIWQAARTGGIDAILEDIEEIQDNEVITERNISNLSEAIWEGGSLKLPLVWERGLIDANYADAEEHRTDYARTVGYFKAQSGMTIDYSFVFENSSAFVVVQYASDLTPESRTVYRITDYPDGGSVTLTGGKNYRFCYTANNVSIVVDYNNMDNYISIDSIVLDKAVGLRQLDDNVSQFFFELADSFSTASVTRNANVTQTKSGNSISIEVSDLGNAYLVYDVPLVYGHNYMLYYSLTGETANEENYTGYFRLHNDTAGSWAGEAFTSFDQTDGADVAGTVMFSLPQSGTYSVGMSGFSGVGQVISGVVYVYDVTGLSLEDINAIDFSTVGSSKMVLKGVVTSSEQNTWKDKKVVFYGDSITKGAYPSMVQARLQFNMVVNAIGGTRFGYISSDPSINANALSSDSRIETLPADADYVLIMGGANDFRYTQIEEELTYSSGFDRTKLMGAIAYTVEKVQAQCPNAKVYLVTLPGGRGDADPSVPQPLPIVADSGAAIGTSTLDIRNAIIHTAEELNIPVIDIWSCGINGLNRETYMKDSVHPNTAGHQLMADYIVNALT